MHEGLPKSWNDWCATGAYDGRILQYNGNSIN